jgi:hypothetical protein
MPSTRNTLIFHAFVVLLNGCAIPCEMCVPITRRYHGDRCEGGTCVGTCRPWGDECVTDTDCGPEDVCHMGYCVWCCPG